MTEFIYNKGPLLYEGKTKKIWQATGYPDCVILENKPDTTAHNNPKYTKIIQGKDVACTTVTSRIFELLKQVDIPVAFRQQLNATEMLVDKVDMSLLECIARRIAVPEGSYAARCPWEAKRPPRRFHRLVTEYFLKTTKGKLIINGETVVEGLTTDEDDPIIINPLGNNWRLFRPDLPRFHPDADLKRTVDAAKILRGVRLSTIDTTVRRTFLLLEGLFAIFGYRFSDFKVEGGLTKDRCWKIADVIDPDSWRTNTWDWTKFDKQSFRDGLDPKEVGKRYDVIARMAEFFRIPPQALVIWKASESDSFDLPEKLPVGVNLVEIIGSGHKETERCLNILEDIQRDFPDGGAIVMKVGRSNGAGPTLACHTVWPVATVCADWKEKPQNLWSHVDMPSRNPHSVYLYDANAIQAALGILAQKNPAVYMDLQYAMEKLDPDY
jgi:phosphoribosylaminoimidazole-succinocarboxamide synthase